MSLPIVLKALGLQDYSSVWAQMQTFTAQRGPQTADEIWVTEHQPVYTLGLNGKPEHILQDIGIPLVKSDRGGQVTYHGPGQLIIYVLLDLRRLNMGPRQVVSLLENAMIDTLKQYGVKSYAKPDAPGVYVGDKKIGALGLRIKRGCSYHGLSLNHCMDLSPFQAINPCGYAGLQATQLTDYGVDITRQELAVPIVHHLIKSLES